MQEQRHWRQVLRRKNEHMLFAEDIGPAGSTIDVEIVESGVIKVTNLEGATEMPWISTGKKGGKKLGLNATNSKTMETLCGTGDYMLWRGWITLVVIRTKYQDRKTKQRIETDAIRILDHRPQRGQQPDRGAPTPDEQAEIARREAEGKS